MILDVLAGPRFLGWVTDVTLLVAVFSLGLALAAIRLRFRNDRLEEEWAGMEARWTPLVLEVIHGERSPESFRETVPERDFRPFLDFLYRFSRRLRGPERVAVSELAAPHLPALVQAIPRSGAETRARMVQIVAEFGLPEYVEVVLDALDDGSPLVSMIAARALFRPGNEEHFPAVLDRLHRFTPWSRHLLAGMLAAGGPGAMDRVRTLFRDPGRTAVERMVAAEALSMVHDAAAADLAVGVLQEEDVPGELVAASLRLVTRVGHGGHRDHILPFLDARDWVVRQTATEALGAVGARDSTDVLDGLLRDGSPWVRLAAARSLKSLGAGDRLVAAAGGFGDEALAARQVLEE